MIVLLECLISCLLFAAYVTSSVQKDPLAWIGDYPPAIRKRCEELGLIEQRQKRFNRKEMIRKILAVIILSVLFALLLKYLNGCKSFAEAFRDAYIIWLAIAWFDALVIDCLWFCHNEKVRIPGTEDMKEYQDYLFHLRQSCIGSLLGLLVCLLSAYIVSLF